MQQQNLLEQRTGVFRRKAIESYLCRHNSTGILRISPPWAWSLFWVVIALVGATAIWSITGRVELTSTGRGILRPAAGMRVLSTQASAVVAEVFARSGQHVHVGQTVLRLDSAPLHAELVEAEQHIARLIQEIDRFKRGQSQYISRQTESQRSKIALLKSQIQSLNETVRAQRIRYEGDQTLERSGLISQAAMAASREAVAIAERQKQSISQQLNQAEQDASTIDFATETDRATKEEELRTAMSRREAIELSLEQLAVTAPTDGYLEAVLVRPGDVLQAGSPVGKLIPDAGVLQAVSFLPERDRAFINAGDRARIELEQLPSAEFGSLTGHVKRISSDLASPYEVKDAFGEEGAVQGPAYRVELTFDAPVRPLPLRPGMLLNVRYTLRRQRVISLVFQPLAKWLS